MMCTQKIKKYLILAHILLFFMVDRFINPQRYQAKVSGDLEFRMYDARWVVEGGRPSIQMFGRTQDGSSVCARVYGHETYMLLRMPPGWGSDTVQALVSALNRKISVKRGRRRYNKDDSDSDDQPDEPEWAGPVRILEWKIVVHKAIEPEPTPVKWIKLILDNPKAVAPIRKLLLEACAETQRNTSQLEDMKILSDRIKDDPSAWYANKILAEVPALFAEMTSLYAKKKKDPAKEVGAKIHKILKDARISVTGKDGPMGADAPWLPAECKNAKFYLADSNIDFVQRFLLDHRAKDGAGHWMITDAKEARNRVSRCDLEVVCDTDQIRVLDVDYGSPIIIMFFDIEVDTIPAKGKFPDPGNKDVVWKDPITKISIVTHREFDGVVQSMTAHLFELVTDTAVEWPPLYLPDTDVIRDGVKVKEEFYAQRHVYPTIRKNISVKVVEGSYVRCSDGELGSTLLMDAEVGDVYLLLDFIKWIKDNDPDKIVGFNSNNFDWRYLYERAKVLGILAEFSRWSRIVDECIVPKMSTTTASATGTLISYHTDPPGITQNDIHEELKKKKIEGAPSGEYSLRAYARTFVKQDKQKLELDKETMGRAPSTPEEDEEPAAYNVRDSMVLYLAWTAMGRTQQILETCRITGVKMEDVSRRNVQWNGICLMLRACIGLVSDEVVKDGYTFVLPYVTRSPPGGYTGATVLEPIAGYYENPIIVLDFTSLYPSIIVRYSYCITTQIGNVPKDWVEGIDYHRVPGSETEIYYYVTPKHITGIVPVMCAHLLKSRVYYKKLMEEEPDPYKKSMYNFRQIALKLAANSVYGFTGSSTSMFPMPYVAAAVTATGRELIERSKKLVESHFVGTGDFERARTVYGDTDSIMVELVNPIAGFTEARAMAWGDAMGKYVTSCLANGIHLKLENLLQRALFAHKKKSYAARASGVIESKIGIACCQQCLRALGWTEPRAEKMNITDHTGHCIACAAATQSVCNCDPVDNPLAVIKLKPPKLYIKGFACVRGNTPAAVVDIQSRFFKTCCMSDAPNAAQLAIEDVGNQLAAVAFSERASKDFLFRAGFTQEIDDYSVITAGASLAARQAVLEERGERYDQIVIGDKIPYFLVRKRITDVDIETTRKIPANKKELVIGSDSQRVAERAELPQRVFEKHIMIDTSEVVKAAKKQGDALLEIVGHEKIFDHYIDLAKENSGLMSRAMALSGFSDAYEAKDIMTVKKKKTISGMMDQFVIQRQEGAFSCLACGGYMSSSPAPSLCASCTPTDKYNRTKNVVVRKYNAMATRAIEQCKTCTTCAGKPYILDKSSPRYVPCAAVACPLYFVRMENECEFPRLEVVMNRFR